MLGLLKRLRHLAWQEDRLDSSRSASRPGIYDSETDESMWARRGTDYDEAKIYDGDICVDRCWPGLSVAFLVAASRRHRLRLMAKTARTRQSGLSRK